MTRALVAAALAAAALLPAPAAVASCHFCALPVECSAACGPVYDVLDALNAPHHASAQEPCDTIEDLAPWLVYCHD